MAIRASNLVALLALVLFAAVAAVSLADFLANAESYRFGTEVAGFRYRSATHYVGLAATELTAALAALLVGARLQPPRRLAMRLAGVVALAALALL